MAEKRLVVRPANTMVSGVFVFREPVDFSRILRHGDIRVGDIVAVRTQNIMASTYKIFDVSSPVPARCFIYISRTRTRGRELSFRVQYSGYESHIGFIIRVKRFLEKMLGSRIYMVRRLQRTVEYSVVFEGIGYYDVLGAMDGKPYLINVGLDGRVQYSHGDNTYIVFVRSMLCMVKDEEMFSGFLSELARDLGAVVVREFK